MKNVGKEALSLNQVHVVRDFPDVFPEELPPDRDIEININVVPRT